MAVSFRRRGFPDPLIPDSEKHEEQYHLEWGKAIEYEWFSKASAGEMCKYLSQKDLFHQRRLYSRGEHSTDMHKTLMIGEDNQSTYTNFDWRPIQVMPRFTNLLVNQQAQRLFNVRAEATDKYSTDLRDQFKKELEDLVVSRQMLEDAKELLGIDMLGDTPEALPQTEEEIDIFMQLGYKPGIEIATEEAIKYTFDLNDFDEVQKQVVRDLVDLGVGGTYQYTDPKKGIVIEAADPADMVYSFPEKRNFEGVYYYGKIRRIPISEFKRITGDKFTDEEIKNVAASSSEWATYHGYSNTRAYREDDMDNMMIDILDFTWKDHLTRTKKKKYHRNGEGFKMIDKDSGFTKPEGAEGYDVVSKPCETWLKGSLVLGTEHIFDFGQVENQVREDGMIKRTCPPFTMYALDLYQGRPKSPIGDCIPYIDQMQQIHVKIQQMIAKARPNGIFVDIHGLEEITMGDGNEPLTPLELIKIYDQTGNVLGTSMTDEGDYNHGKMPIQELKNGIIDGLDRLIGAYNHYMNLVRETLGIPQGMDATLPHPDTLVGVQKNAAVSSNTATRHILDSVLYVTSKTASSVALRIKDIFMYSDLKDAYVQAIGQINMDLLESIKNYALHDFGVFIELKPDAEEKQYLEGNIMMALQTEQIDLADAIDIRGIQNIKLANQVLKIRKKRKEQQKQQMEQQMIQANAQAQAQAAQQASQAKQAELQAQVQADLAKLQAEQEMKLKLVEAEKNAKSELMEQEFDYNMQLQGLQVKSQDKREKMKEDEKMKRQDRNNTQQSQIADQKAKDKKPLNFESSMTEVGNGIETEDLKYL